MYTFRLNDGSWSTPAVVASDGRDPTVTADSAGVLHAGWLGAADTGGPAFMYAYGEPVHPTLTMNYTTGQPGSFFTVIGEGYSPDSTATITVNGHTLGTALVDASGALTFILDAALAGEGSYYVTVKVNPSATARFTLEAAAPLRLKEGSGTIVAIPGGIAFTDAVCLPLIHR